MAPTVALVFYLIILSMVDYNLASRPTRIERRLNILEDRVNAESTFRREDMWNLFERLESMSAVFNTSFKDGRCKGQQGSGEENSLHSSTSHELSKLCTDWRRDLMQLTVAYKDEKKLNAKLRKEFPRVVGRMQAAEEAIAGVGVSLEEVKDDLKALSTDLKTMLDEMHVNRMKQKEHTQEHTDLKEHLLQIEHQLLQIIKQNNQSIEIAQLKNEMIQLKETCDSNKEASTMKMETSTLTMEASTLNNERFKSCLELYKKGHRVSGQYDVYPDGTSNPIRVFCDQDTDGGGWIVFQRRKDGSEDFYREWLDYKRGFGDLDGEFWLGNENLNILTSTCCSQLRIDLKNSIEEHRYAIYNEFQIKSESEKYSLNVGGYSGNVGYDSLKYHIGRPFTTKDVDNDRRSYGNCAEECTGAWWYGNCFHSNLNGPYLHEKMYWRNFRKHQLTFTEMKFRRLV